MAIKFLKSPGLPGLLLILTAVPLASSLYDLTLATRWNEKMLQGHLKDLGSEGLPPEVELARANELALGGQMELALGLYKKMEENPNHPYGKDAGYNAATLYLKRAIEGGGPEANPQLIPLVELAKESLRTVLRKNPEDWDARYNLDRALRLMPENEDEDNDGGAPPLGAERAPTTMRGFTLGLP